jgi:aconitate hydratase
VVSIGGLAGDLKPLSLVPCTIRYADGTEKTIQIKCRIDTAIEIEYVENGGCYVLQLCAACQTGQRRPRSGADAVMSPDNGLTG